METVGRFGRSKFFWLKIFFFLNGLMVHPLIINSLDVPIDLKPESSEDIDSDVIRNSHKKIINKTSENFIDRKVGNSLKAINRSLKRLKKRESANVSSLTPLGSIFGLQMKFNAEVAQTISNLSQGVSADLSTHAGTVNKQFSTMDDGLSNVHRIASTTMSDLSQGQAGKGSWITKYGSGALEKLSGYCNTAIGGNALNRNSVGFNNTAIGYESLGLMTSGCANTSIGGESLAANIIGSYNTVLGYSAGGGDLATHPYNIIAIGNNAAYNNVGSDIIATGSDVASFNSGMRIIACGGSAARYNTGNDVIATGSSAAFANNASNVIALGHLAAAYNVNKGFDLIAIGTQSAYRNSGRGLIAIGNTAGFRNSGTDVIATGSGAAYKNTGNNLIATGTGAGYFNRGNSVIAIGTSAAYNNQGSDLIAIGTAAGFSNSGLLNIAIGSSSLSTASGNRNTALGHLSLQVTTTGSSNVAVGFRAFDTLTTGSANIALGLNAGHGLRTGNNNVYIGANVQGISNESNSIRIGTKDHRIYLSGVYSHADEFGATLLIKSDGQVVSSLSSQRYKKNIVSLKNNNRQIDLVLEKILQLNPVYYVVKNDSQNRRRIGLIAEELIELFPEFTVLDQAGQPNSIRYDQMAALLVYGFQELFGNYKKLEKKLDCVIDRLDKQLISDQMISDQILKEIEANEFEDSD